MEEIKKSEDYMNMSMSISPEKYFDSRFDGQEKLFTEKFNTLQTQINCCLSRDLTPIRI